MESPVLSVVMPVYNGARFLKEAIDSVLSQDFTEFELIIVNDGSTDQTEAVIQCYTDQRIRYLANTSNCGIVFSLNRGVEVARGYWLARMDADDVCLPGRFRAQMTYLQQHSEADVLSTTVRLIDEEGKDAGVWPDDMQTIAPMDIRRKLPVNNCVSHPTIMTTTRLMRAFPYRKEQQGSEDYDLWLRLSACGKSIHKLPEAFLLHRIVNTSVTRNRQRNVFSVLYEAKTRFLQHSGSMPMDPAFRRAVRLRSYLDLVRSWIKNLKGNHVV